MRERNKLFISPHRDHRRLYSPDWAWAEHSLPRPGCWYWLHHQMVNSVSSTSVQIRFKKVFTVFEGESSHCLMPSCKTTKLQIRASEEMCPSYRCGIEKTSSQMRTPDHQGGSKRLFFSQKYRQWLPKKSKCCSTPLVRYILFYFHLTDDRPTEML